jgi:dihydroorotate dehydrogenase (fumarate)
MVSMSSQLSAKGANSLVLFNRFFEPDIDVEKLEMSASEVFSSPSDIRNTLRWIGLISAQLPEVELAASTGIQDGEAVIKMLLAGAQVTQICSTIYINGLGIIPEILKDLKAFMKKWDFRKIEDFRGRLSYKNVPDPIVYERAQFMKYFSNR